MNEYLVLLLKDLIIFPSQKVKVELISSISKDVIDNSVNNEVIVVAPLNPKEVVPNIDDLPKIGVVAKIKSKLELSNTNYRVTLEGINRVIIDDYFNKKSSDDLFAKTSILKLPKFNEKEVTAIKRKLKTTVKKYVDANLNISNSIISSLNNLEDLDVITDTIISFIPLSPEKKLEYMQMINPINRAKNLLMDIEEEIEIIKLEEEIDSSVAQKLQTKEKKYLLREKLQEIQFELGEVNNKEEDINNFINILNSLKLNSKTTKKIKIEIDKYKNLPEESAEAAIIKNYLNIVLNLPWNKKSKENDDYKDILNKLNNNHYGLDEIKDRIIEYSQIKKMNKDFRSPILCLVGPPGVGKTTIAESIAKALGREFYKISVGGLNDSIELIGTRRTYLGAKYGKIIGSIIKSEVNNPVVLIDEVDKMTKDYKGDPASSLLEVLDSSQNNAFVDNYVEEPFDLSNVFFILTANSEEDIPYALHDRLEIIHLNSYTLFEKIDISKNHLVPNIKKMYKYKNKLNISNENLSYIISNYTKEAGVRDLTRVLEKVIRKGIISNLKTVNLKTIKRFLGESKYSTNTNYNIDNKVGVSNLLAYTKLGGQITCVEAIKYKGDEKVVVTGLIGKVMDESIKVTLSYLKNHHKVDFKNYDIHIHYLDASTKKDGPSAGLSTLVAIHSLYLNKAVSNQDGFTGEISLNGNVLKIGGVKEKVIAAVNSGLTRLFLPIDNKNDILILPQDITKNIEIIYVSNYKDIKNIIFP